MGRGAAGGRARVVVTRTRWTNYGDGAARPVDRAGGVGITSTYLECPRAMGPRRWGGRKENENAELKRVKVAQYERALVYRDRNLERVLRAGQVLVVGPRRSDGAGL